MNNIIDIEQPLPVWLQRVGDQQFHQHPIEYHHKTMEHNQPFFGKLLYEHNQNYTYPDTPWFVYAVTSWIIHDLVPHTLGRQFGYMQRVVLNGQTGDCVPGRHLDYHDEGMFTVVYYLEGSTGGTRFYDGEQGNTIHTTPFVCHNAVVFPSDVWHEALPCQPGEWRTSLGISFRVK